MEIGKPKKIFIVDDDTMLTETLKDWLTRKIPHQVFTFDTGEACLQHLFENPDVVVLDYYLNTVSKDAANGMEILKEIKKYNPAIHVILLSSQENYRVAVYCSILQGGVTLWISDSFGNTPWNEG